LNEFLRSRFPHAHVQNTRSKSLADALATSTACLIDSSSVWADAVLAGTNLLVTDFSTYASATKLAELTKKSKVYFSAEQLPLEYSRQTKSKAITEIGEAWIEFRTLVLECTQIQVDSEVKKRLKHVDIAPDSTQKD
jgi:predicted transcriptional regulator